MAIEIPTTAEVVAEIKTRIESSINQETPALAKAFVSVLSAALGMVVTSLDKLVADRSRQTLALTATGTGLDTVGQNFGVTRTAATSAEVNVTITGTNGAVALVSRAWVCTANNLQYYPDQAYTISGGSVVATLVCATPGEAGNTVSGDEFILSIPTSGITPSAAWQSVDTAGVDQESDSAYRNRILNVIRTVGGGGNSADYREWGEAVAGVSRVFPYTGISDSTHGSRDIYVEADTAGRVADSTLQDAVEAAILVDPDTGLSRVPLGLPAGTLNVDTITITDIYVDVQTIDVPAGVTQGDVEADIEEAVEAYLISLAPFVDGLDSEVDKNDVISSLSVGKVIQEVLESYSSTAEGVTVSLSSGGADLGVYELGYGELAKLADGGVSFS